ncbi:hypothetical protein GCM10022286_11610 [Gryllotalpicola daejeonensis]|uniref:Low molecular weight protein antigen 6 PH domain-containing protein n=1 Tax=Gryllotalpicola daejeonensis TaxID=993087 RepID=A0ABP7ZI13_9MICO
MRVTEESKTLRPRFGIVLTVLVWCVCAAALVTMIVTGRWGDLARYGVLALLVAYVVWLLFWSPSVTISLAGVSVRNLLRVHEVSWPAIQNVDTKYALTLFTPKGKIVAWGAPAPSRYATMRATGVGATRHPEFLVGPESGSATRPDALLDQPPQRVRRGDLQGIPDSTFMAGSIRPSDIPSSDSGLAALYVRRYWDELHGAGYLDSGAVEGTGVTTRWLGREAAALIALAIIAAACVALVH